MILHCCRSQSLEKWLENIRRLQFSVRKQFLIIIVNYKHVLLKLMNIQAKPVAARSVTKGIPSLSTHSYQISFKFKVQQICNNYQIFNISFRRNVYMLDLRNGI